MANTLRLLVTSRSKQDIEALAALLNKLPGMEIKTRVITNGHADPLYGVTDLPDALVHHMDGGDAEHLKALAARSAAARVPTIVLGPAGNAELMRLAMQGGARDFLTHPVVAAELTAALQQIAKDKRLIGTGQSGRLTALINAKGGSGASLIACNLGHMLAAHCGMRVAIMDLDLQFGTQALSLDLHPEQGLLEALKVADTLDLVALQGYVAKHKSGLHLIAAKPEHVSLPDEVSPKRLGQLLDLMLTGYEHMIVDLPRLIDPLMHMVVERSERIVICLQQNVANIRDATRLLNIMRNDLEIPSDRFTVVVNRYQENDPVRTIDIKQSLKAPSLVLVPNDFKRVSAAANLGTPLYEFAPSSPITRALLKFADEVSGKKEAEKKGLMGRLFSRISPEG